MRRFHHHESEIADWRTASPIVPLPFFAVLRGTVDHERRHNCTKKKKDAPPFGTTKTTYRLFKSLRMTL